jgi:superfamily II DNA helicase RecQ
MVFVNTRKQCDKVYEQLANMGYDCTTLHGSRTQDQREVRDGCWLLPHAVFACTSLGWGIVGQLLTADRSVTRG